MRQKNDRPTRNGRASKYYMPGWRHATPTRPRHQRVIHHIRHPPKNDAFRQSTRNAGLTEEQRRQRERYEFCLRMAELQEQRERQQDEYRSLFSGHELEYDDETQQFILTPGQSRLWNIWMIIIPTG